MQFSSVISHCNITFLLFWLSQGSVATLITWGGYLHMYRSSLILTVKTALKFVDFFTKLQTKISWLHFLWLMVYMYGMMWHNRPLDTASLRRGHSSLPTAFHNSFTVEIQQWICQSRHISCCTLCCYIALQSNARVSGWCRVQDLLQSVMLTLLTSFSWDDRCIRSASVCYPLLKQVRLLRWTICTVLIY